MLKAVQFHRCECDGLRSKSLGESEISKKPQDKLMDKVLCAPFRCAQTVTLTPEYSPEHWCEICLKHGHVLVLVAASFRFAVII